MVGEMLNLQVATLNICASLVAILLKSLCVGGDSEGNMVRTQTTDNFERNVIELRATNCTTSHVSLKSVINEEGCALLSLSALGHHKSAPVTVLPCRIHLESQTRYFISAVLLQHSSCGFGVFVVLWDNYRWTRWDVCSAWHVPGPDFRTSSNYLNILVEVSEVHDPFDFIISVKAEQLDPRKLEVHLLSADEGKL